MSSEQALSVMFTTAQNMEPDPSRPDYSSNNGLFQAVHPAKPGNSGVPNGFGGWGLVDLKKAMNGPGQLLGTFRAALPSGTADVWSNDISDVALAARKIEDDAEHRAWLDTLQSRGWQQGLPAGASDGDKVDYATGAAREAARQAREYQGSLVKSGAGTLTLAGANTYRGLTTVDGGELRIDGSIASGAVVNPAGRLKVNGRAADIAVNGGLATIAGTSAALAIDQGGTAAVTGTGSTGEVRLANGFASLGGSSGKVSVQALGVAAITGRTGDVAVDGGRASLDGSSGDVTVGNGGLVNGNGAMRSLNATAGGTVAPGHSVGRLSVAGDLSLASGSTYAVELSPSGASDRIDVGGKASLAGGALSLALENTPPPLSGEQSRSVLGRSFVILNAAGGVDGQFASPGAYLFVSPSLAYGPTSISLTVNRNAARFASVANTDKRAQRGERAGNRRSGQRGLQQRAVRDRRAGAASHALAVDRRDLPGRLRHADQRKPAGTRCRARSAGRYRQWQCRQRRRGGRAARRLGPAAGLLGQRARRRRERLHQLDRRLPGGRGRCRARCAAGGRHRRLHAQRHQPARPAVLGLVRQLPSRRLRGMATGRARAARGGGCTPGIAAASIGRFAMAAPPSRKPAR